MDELDKLSEEDYVLFDGFKIVLFGWYGGEWNGDVSFGNTPEEVVLNMSSSNVDSHLLPLESRSEVLRTCKFVVLEFEKLELGY